MAEVEFNQVSKLPAADDVPPQADHGFLVLVGPSGPGKENPP
ncbi:hypothetical protein [Dactylosporangium sp. NPDC005555]